VNVVIGDGRITLQDARPGQYDMLVLDAFSSDAIPVHLLTLEAMQLYTSRLKDDGILAIHISNRYLALEPVVAALAEREHLYALVKSDGQVSASSQAQGRTAAQWMVLSRRPEAIARLSTQAGWRLPDGSARASIWTDDYSNIFSVLR
jgi:spermidine synthase